MDEPERSPHPSPPAHTGSPGVTAEGIYGCLAVAVVCVAWSGDNLVELAVEVLGYGVALWLFHVYARVAQRGWVDRTVPAVLRWVRHEWPHVQAALPALAATTLGWVAGWDPVLTADLALAATGATLLAWQVALLRPGRRNAAAFVVTLALDALVVLALIQLRLWVK